MSKIEISAAVHAPANKVWEYFTKPEHIVNWNFAIEEWQCPKAVNDLKPGGKFSYRMEAKDGSMGFDFEGTYDEIAPLKSIRYHLDDERNVEVRFEESEGITTVTEVFDIEKSNPADMQRQGWQAILDNFRKYVENDKSDNNE